MRVFCDIDGVLASFIPAALARHGRTLEPYPAGLWALWEALGMTEADFWGPIKGEEFWADLPVTEDAPEILAELERRFGPTNICLLTSRPLDPASYTGKARWVARHFPAYSRRLLVGACKEFCAHRDALLIDDSDTNVDRFKAAGGWAILLPRPWNRGHGRAGNALGDLRDSLQRLDSLHAWWND